ncbi:MAG: hypothetical protein IJW15_01955 [Clostridia bacterium]|nr:hypothetical protein [Clostridia bacterium]
MVLEIYGTQAEIKENKKILSLCGEIKDLAEVQLKQIATSEGDERHTCDGVMKFLEDSLEKLVGKRQAKRIFKNTERTIPKLSGALCYIISEIGLRLGRAESDADDEN